MSTIQSIRDKPGPWLTAAEVSPFYRSDPNTIRHLARAGRLPFEVDLPSQHRVRIYKQSFLDWYDRNYKEEAS